MNWTGAILLITATSLIGFERSAQLKRRPRQITQFKLAMQIMEAEIVYSQQTLADVCATISRQIDKPINEFFSSIAKKIADSRDLSKLWTENLDLLEQQSALYKAEISILKQFGQTLGHFDIVHQQKQIQLTTLHLDRILIEAEERHTLFGKVYRGIGILTGLLIALILI